MTILHVTDLHFERRWFEWLISSAPQHDLLVISGDLLDLSHPVYPTKQMHWVSSWIRSFDGPVCLCSGNHDLMWDDREERWQPAAWLQDLASDRVIVDGQAREIGGTRIAAISALTPEDHAADVWVIHAPPAGISVSRNAQLQDDGDVRSPVWRASTRPIWVLSGHVHRPLRWHDTARGIQFVNPGCNRSGRFPNHVLIDLERGSLIHVSDGTGGARCSVSQVGSVSLKATSFDSMSLQLIS